MLFGINRYLLTEYGEVDNRNKEINLGNNLLMFNYTNNISISVRRAKDGPNIEAILLDEPNDRAFLYW